MLLFLNDIAGSEVLVILAFILMFFGSKSIPGIAKTMGSTIRQIKDASSEIQTEIKKSAGDFKGDLNLEGLIRDTTNEIQRPLDQYSTELNDSIKLEPPRNPHVQSPNQTPNQVVESTEESIVQKVVVQEPIPSAPTPISNSESAEN
ncbi:MAG: twin-arginine translocase TatA/TatE family subunit [Bacteroidota bacterium]